MQDRPNYQYNDYNTLKDPNQQGQNSAKQGKKSNHNKYYKQGLNKNNNFDDMNNINTDHNPNYRHPRYPKQNYPETGNRSNNPNFKKKKGKKRDINNEFQYQGNNAIEINQPMKEEYIEQNNSMNLGGNNHPNMYGGKGYKKNQNIYTNNNLNLNNNVINNNMSNINMNTSLGSMNSNTNSTGTSNISNLNITPQSNNQISPLSYNSNSPLNTKIPQQNQNSKKQPSIYINPILSIDSLRKNDNEKDMNIKSEKLCDNLPEDNINIPQGNKLGNNAMNILGNNLNNINNNLTSIDLSKNPNDFINQQDYLNQKFIPQQNNFYIPSYGINGITNIGNGMDNMPNLNNINTMNNMNNINQGSYQNIRNPYNQSPISHIGPSVPNINNINNQMNNLSFNNFQRQFYDNNSNNKIYPNQLQQNFGYNNPQEDLMTHKKMKKNTQNNSPFDQNNHTNPQINIGMGNLNYNGPNNFKSSNSNNQIKIGKLSQSSKPPKNTNPFINNNDNIILGNQPQSQNIPQMLNINYGQINNRNIYMQQGIPVIRNPHMNQGYINNNNININNNQLKTEFPNASYNPNMINNKQKYPKYNNPNSYQNQKHNNINNNNQMYQKNKSNNDINNNNQNMPNNKNYGFKSGNEHGNYIGSNKSMEQRQSFLCLNIKFGDKTRKNIIINKWDESQSVLDELLKEGKIRTEREKKMILEKINKIYELVGRKKIYDLGIKAYTYKNLCEIHHKLNYQNLTQERKLIKNKLQVIKKNKSFETFENIFDDDKKLKLENVRNVGSLNITF